MSNALAIAAVTAVLRDLLNNGVVQHDLSANVGVVSVTSKPPDVINTGPNEAAQLNLYLYQVTPNQGWRDVGQPARDASGARLTNPPLALDLHYLLMAYGGDDFVAEILLGYGMQVLHETPVLTRCDAIRAALAPQSPVTRASLPPAYKALSAADLADQVEMIKIIPDALGTEELSKLWAAFQAHYRMSAAYRASVVLIESARSTRTALPVLKHKVYALPMERPTIDQVTSAAVSPADSRITTASTLLIRGAGLKGPVTLVQLGETLVPGAALTVTDTQISFALAATPAIRAGVQSIQVIHQVLMGEPAPGTPHAGVTSNVAAFVLQPTITVPATVTAASKQVAVSFNPPVGKTQRVTLFLYELMRQRAARHAAQLPGAEGQRHHRSRDRHSLDHLCVRRRGAGRLSGLRPGGWRRKPAGAGWRGQVRDAQGEDHMSAQTGWLELNQRYLMAEAARRAAGAGTDCRSRRWVPPEPAPVPSLLDFAADAPPALVRVAAVFGLSPFERDVLLLCAAAELDGSVAPLCVRAAGDPARPYPTFGLALTALAEPHWSALAPVAPLRRWRLVELVNAGVEPLATTRLRIDERVLHHLAGLDYLDERLAAMTNVIMSTDEPTPEQAELAASLAGQLRRTQGPTAIQLCGDDRAGKRSVAAAACSAIGGSLYELAVADIPPNAHEREG